MKVLIGFALLSVAFALPAIAPVSLPEPAAPAMEAEFQRPDISPLLIPKEVIDALRRIGESPFDMPADTVQIVEVAEDFLADKEPSADAVIVVDHVQEEVPLEAVAEEIVPSPVNFVDVAENVDAGVALEQTPDNADDVVFDHITYEDANLEAAVDSVKFVDIAENVDYVPEAPENVDAVIFVDHAEEPVVLAEDGAVESENANESNVIVVDDVSVFENAPENEIAGDAVHFVDEAPSADLEQVVSKVLVADAVKVVYAPMRYPAKRYDNPLLRSMS